MVFDTFLENLPLVGFHFEKLADFWRANVALANTTHTVLGFGLALIIFTPKKKVGAVLVLISLLVHLTPFLV